MLIIFRFTDIWRKDNRTLSSEKKEKIQKILFTKNLKRCLFSLVLFPLSLFTSPRLLLLLLPRLCAKKFVKIYPYFRNKRRL